MSLTLMYITNNVDIALIAEKHGVDRIWVDLETLGKEERQKNMNTVKSNHTVEDVQKMSKHLTTSELMVRINPINLNTPSEIEEVIAAGAQRIMLPMWQTKEEVAYFLNLVSGRVKTTLLLETKDAYRNLDSILTLKGIEEIHIGLNDLHLSLGLQFMFEPLAYGIVEEIATKLKEANIPFGFGGIARLGHGDLSSEYIIKEHYRIGSTRAILSRSFCNTDDLKNYSDIDRLFASEMFQLKTFEKSLNNLTVEDFLENQVTVKEKVFQIINNMSKGK